MTNSAFSFTQFSNVDSQGWRSNRNGYLTESEHVFALGLFLRLKEQKPEKAFPHLKPHLRKLLKNALKEIDTMNIIPDLKRVEFVGYDLLTQDH